MLLVKCTHCSASAKVEPAWLGREVKCAKCHNVFRIPKPLPAVEQPTKSEPKASTAAVRRWITPLSGLLIAITGFVCAWLIAAMPAKSEAVRLSNRVMALEEELERLNQFVQSLDDKTREFSKFHDPNDKSIKKLKLDNLECDILTVRGMRVIDADGISRIGVTALFGEPAFEMLRSDGKPWLRLSERQGTTGVHLFDAAHNLRAVLGQLADGDPFLSLNNTDQKPRIALSILKQQPAFTILDENGKVIWESAAPKRN